MSKNLTYQILVVDDDERLRLLLKRFLNKKGYYVIVAKNASDARLKLTYFDVDLVILDLMMPGETGLEFACWFTQNHIAPILMLTAMDSSKDRIFGLETGADDYLTKPFETQELLLRIQNILKRTKPQTIEDEANGPVKLGTLYFDTKRMELHSYEGQVEHLTETEKFVLQQLSQNRGKVVSRQALSKNNDDPGRSLDVLITRLRKKINDDPKSPKWILTVRGQGYKLMPD